MNKLLDPPGIKMAVQRMACTACGAEANASCTCGVAYTPKSVRAAEAVKANPEKSDRAIAKEIDASPTTVGKAREQLSTDGQLRDQPRTGLDGKARKTPVRASHNTPEKPPPDPTIEAVELLNELVPVLRRMNPSQLVNFRRIALQAMSDANLKEEVTYF